MMKSTFKEKTIYKNKNGKIISIENLRFGGVRYILLDANENYVKDIYAPFKVSDYL